MHNFIKKYSGILLDINGVLTQNKQLIRGSIELINYLREQNISFRLLTNCVSLNTDALYTNLINLGLDINRNELISVLDVTKKRFSNSNYKPFCLVHNNIKNEFKSFNAAQANCVLIGDARDGFNYENLNIAFNIVKKGGQLFTLGDNRYFKSQNKLMLDSGAFTHLLEHAAQSKPIIFGKPEISFFNSAVKDMNCVAQHCLMIGDDIYGDIEGALNTGLNAILVKTGKYQKGDEFKLKREVNTIESIAQILS